MAFELENLSILLDLPYDQVIDVRSPAEYVLDHIPGAINLPVLDDNERAEVGKIYVQDSPFRARKMGAALVARNAARHIETFLAGKDGSYKPLIYCWRGGQRSGSFATILAQIGWRVEILKGGYQIYRHHVVHTLYGAPFPAPLIVLCGNTGTAKTELLIRLKQRGIQIIDLEDLANHRGSVFGGQPDGQPSQKAFESALAFEIIGLNPTRPVVVEAESSRIGNLNLVPSLWQAMQTAPRLTLKAPLKERARYLTATYSNIASDREMLKQTINRLKTMHASDRINDWLKLADEGSFEPLAASLMAHHYDPRYEKMNARHDDGATDCLTLESLSPSGLDRAAEQIVGLVEARFS